MVWGIAYGVLKQVMRALLVAVGLFIAIFLGALLTGNGPPWDPNNTETNQLLGRIFSLESLPYWLAFIAINWIADLVWQRVDVVPEKIFDSLAKFAPVHGVILNHMQNTATIEISKLDEFIKHIYQNTKGNIYLFNPPDELFKEKPAKEFQDIQAALRNNAKNIDAIIVKVPDSIAFNRLPLLTDPVLKSKIQVLQLEGEELATAAHVRAAGYSTRAWGRRGNGCALEYFLYRPIAAPYGAQGVIIKRSKALKKIKMIRPTGQEESLYDAVTRFCGA